MLYPRGSARLSHNQSPDRLPPAADRPKPPTDGRASRFPPPDRPRPSPNSGNKPDQALCPRGSARSALERSPGPFIGCAETSRSPTRAAAAHALARGSARRDLKGSPGAYVACGEPFSTPRIGRVPLLTAATNRGLKPALIRDNPTPSGIAPASGTAVSTPPYLPQRLDCAKMVERGQRSPCPKSYSYLSQSA